MNSARAEGTALTGSAGHAVPRIVIADHSDDGRARLAEILRDQPWQVIGAADGRAVIDLVGAGHADLVMMDSRLGALDGLEVCRRIRRDGDHRLVPIVLISNGDEVADRIAAFEAGANDVFAKPLQRDEVVARVRSMLRLKSASDRLEDVRQVIFALAKAAEAKDRFTLEHAERVADSSSELARRLKLAPKVIEQIRVGALIHDVGKLAVPDDILNKPGPLTADEFDIVKNHPVVGAEIVLPLMGQRDLYAIVRHHHERYDGRGYPDGLAGEAIPISARIAAVCDAYDAMVNQRSYRAAVSHQRALETLLAGRDEQWDGRIVDAFVAIQEQR
ncbi:MAG TPA: HD domain-containing phosphohydrolase [Candidatus Dormibacteraeota bacterium]|jgi:putative two-component system response regulator